MSRAYDVLLLDFGGVCLLNPIELHSEAEAHFGLAAGTLDWLGPIDPSTDPLWRELCGGAVLQEREYWSQRAGSVSEAVGRPVTLHEYFEAIYTPARDELIRPGCFATVDTARSLEMGVSILTNDLKAFHGPDWQQGITLFEAIDHLVDCSDTGVLKPDPRAFATALAAIETDPSRVLFVDDQQLSVAGAEAVGIDALWFDIARPSESWDAVAERLER